MAARKQEPINMGWIKALVYIVLSLTTFVGGVLWNSFQSGAAYEKLAPKVYVDQAIKTQQDWTIKSMGELKASTETGLGDLRRYTDERDLVVLDKSKAYSDHNHDDMMIRQTESNQKIQSDMAKITGMLDLLIQRTELYRNRQKPAN